MVELVVNQLRKNFGMVSAVDDVSFNVADGEFLTLLGPSGCGKSTTLAMLAGLETPTSGKIQVGPRIFFDSDAQIDIAAEDRNCGLVFQSYALWPHMTVWQNLAYPLKLRRFSKAKQASQIESMLDLVEMTDYANRYPHELSGGQQQRVALARTLVYEPSILLLDEPLSNLDAKLRDKARFWLKALQRQVGLTTVFVTHDQVEALTLSDRMVVMNQGKIAQIGTPREIYEHPVSPFVADFIGTSSFLAGRVETPSSQQAAGSVAVSHGLVLLARFDSDLARGQEVTLALRPEGMTLVGKGMPHPAGEGVLADVTVRSMEYFGSRWQYVIEFADTTIKVDNHQELDPRNLAVWIPADSAIIFLGNERAKGGL